MKDFLFALGAVSPIIITVALGYVLKRIGIIPYGIAKPLNKIVFRVLLPVMLFLNIYKLDGLLEVEYGYLIYVAVAVAVVAAIAIPLSALLTHERSRRAPLIQAAFRSNYALIGIPLAISLAGEGAAASASLLSAVSIPLFNVLAVLSLSAFDPSGKKPTVAKVIKGILTNPLIIGIVSGILVLGIRAVFESCDISFRLTDVAPVYKVLEYLSGAATPLALLSLGAQFEFSQTRSMKKEIIIGTVMRVFAVPTLLITIACVFFGDFFSAAHYACFIGVFATPLAVSTVPMTQEMGSDGELAGQLVVWTTIASAFGVFIFSYLLKVLGFF